MSRTELFALSEEVAALEAALWRLDGPARLPALISLAWQLRQRDCDRALRLAEEAEALLERSGTDDSERQRRQARLMLVRGEIDWLGASLDRAETHAGSAKAVFEGLDEPIDAGDAKWLLASIRQDRGDLLGCNECLESAAADYRKGGDQVRVDIAIARSLHLAAFHDPHARSARLTHLFNAGAEAHPAVTAWLESARAAVAGATCDMNTSIQHFLQAYHAARESGQLLLAILSATNGADVFANLGDLEAALEWDERALALARDTGLPSVMANPLMQTGNVLRLLGRHVEAKAALLEAQEVMAGLEGSNRFAITLLYRGELALDMDDPAAALAFFNRAEARAKALEDADLDLSCRRGQAAALCRLARPEEALVIVRAALAAAKALGNADEQIKVLRVYAELHQRHALPTPEGVTAPNAALRCLREALIVAEGIQGYTPSSELLEEVASAHAACGDYHLAYTSAMAAAAARDSRRLDGARNRAIAMQVRKSTEHAESVAEHHRQLAQAQATRAEALAESLATLETLGLIGRRLTANLDLDVTLESVYAAINEIMDAPSIGIAVVDDAASCLDYRLVMMQGERKEPFRVPLDTDSFGCWCVKHRSDILIGDIETEYSRYLGSGPPAMYGKNEKSLVFVPLLIEDRVSGMLTVQSHKQHAYDQRTVETVRAIGSYIAIALENSKLFRRVIDSEKSLRQEHNALLNAQAELKQLCGIIPICSACKKIRDDGGSWHQLERYIRDHSEAEFTHGICPECVERLYGDLLKKPG